MAHQRIIAIVISAGLLLLILELVRRRRLMERYALLWLFSSFLLLVLSIWSGLLNALASAFGVSYPPSALFAVAFGVVLILLIHFSLAVSRLSDQNKVLAQRVGLMQQQLDEHVGGTKTSAPSTETSVPRSDQREGERVRQSVS
jgi:hypothetical protein